jgi:hypothetical protein
VEFLPQCEDRFYRRLNPDMHLKHAPDAPSGYRISSAAFKQSPRRDGAYRNSVEWSQLTTLDEARLLRDVEHSGWGLGSVPYYAILDDPAAWVLPDPLPQNPGHSELGVTSDGAAKRLARSVTVHDWPSES